MKKCTECEFFLITGRSLKVNTVSENAVVAFCRLHKNSFIFTKEGELKKLRCVKNDCV